MLWYPVGFAAGYLALLLFVAAPLRRSGAFTLPDFCQVRLGSPRLRKLATAFVVFIGWLYLVPQLQGAGLTLTTVTGEPYALGALLVGVVVTANVALGGMRAITFVQAFQYWLKLTALAVPAIFLILQWQADGRPAVTPPDGPVFPAATTVVIEEPATLTLADGSTMEVTGGRASSRSTPASRCRWCRTVDDRARAPTGCCPATPAGPRAVRHLLADPGDVPGHDGAAARAGALLHQPGRRRGPTHDARRARPGRAVLPAARRCTGCSAGSTPRSC